MDIRQSWLDGSGIAGLADAELADGVIDLWSVDADQTPLKATDDCAKSFGVEMLDKARQVRSQSSSLMSLRRCQETPWKVWTRARSASQSSAEPTGPTAKGATVSSVADIVVSTGRRPYLAPPACIMRCYVVARLSR